MHDEKPTAQSTEHAEKLGYEDSDIAIPVLLKWGFFLVVFVGVTSVLVMGIYSVLVTHALNRPNNATLSTARPQMGPDMPQLQSDPVKDIRDYRRAENKRINGYGIWKDGDGKDVQYVPIERGMQMVEAKGIPIESADAAKNDVTPPAVDRGFVDNPLPAQDNMKSSVPGKTGEANSASMDDSSFQQKSPGM